MHLSNFYFPPPAPTCRYRIDPARRLRVEEYQGWISLEQLRGNVAAMVEDPEWSADLHGLIDFSRASLDLTANDVIRLGLILRRDDYHSNGWLAFAVGDSATYGLVRMLSHWARTTDRTRIFLGRAEAERWVIRNADHVPPGFGSGFSDVRETEVRNAG